MVPDNGQPTKTSCFNYFKNTFRFCLGASQYSHLNTTTTYTNNVTNYYVKYIIICRLMIIMVFSWAYVFCLLCCLQTTRCAINRCAVRFDRVNVIFVTRDAFKCESINKLKIVFRRDVRPTIHILIRLIITKGIYLST